MGGGATPGHCGAGASRCPTTTPHNPRTFRSPTSPRCHDGAPRAKGVVGGGVIWDFTKRGWSDRDGCMVRDWVPRQKVLSQFPELADAIKTAKTRGQVMQSNSDLESNTRYYINNSFDMSEDIQ